MIHRRTVLQLIAFRLFAFTGISHATVSMMNKEDAFDKDLTHEQAKRIHQLTSAEVAEIGEVLISNVGSRWRKVAMVVGLSMIHFKGRFDGVPDVYYARRIAELVATDKLEAQGDLRRMRFSEVRIAER